MTKETAAETQRIESMQKFGMYISAFVRTAARAAITADDEATIYLLLAANAMAVAGIDADSSPVELREVSKRAAALFTKETQTTFESLLSLKRKTRKAKP